MQSDLAVTNKQYCQSCILLVLYIIQTYDARKLKHKINSGCQYDTLVSIKAVISTNYEFLVTAEVLNSDEQCLHNFFCSSGDT